MHSRKHSDEQAQTLQQHAARIAFPNWTPQGDDWTHLYTGFHDGSRYTDVAVYRPSREGGHERICYRRYAGEDLMAFWTHLANTISE